MQQGTRAEVWSGNTGPIEAARQHVGIFIATAAGVRLFQVWRRPFQFDGLRVEIQEG